MLHTLSALCCLVATVLHVAILRSPDIQDSADSASGRKLTAVGLAIAGIYILYVNHLFGSANNVFSLAMGLIALGQIKFAISNLTRLKEGSHKWSSHLPSSE